MKIKIKKIFKNKKDKDILLLLKLLKKIHLL